MTIQISMPPYNILRGDTWRSPKYSFFNEDLSDVLGEDFTSDEIDAAIADGTLTFRNWKDYVIDADVFTEGTLWFTLTDYIQIDATGRFLWFEISAQQNEDIWEDSDQVKGLKLPINGTYDIQFCKNAEVVTLWKGSLSMLKDVTRRDVCN